MNASKGLIATATTTVDATPEQVWSALIDPAQIREYMFGTNVVSEWKEGASIVWKGEWEGRRYEDKGEILDMEAERLLRYTHYSPLSGLPETPENFHTVSIALKPRGSQTEVSLSQDNNATEEERDHSARNWEMMLAGLKKIVEKTPAD